MAKSGLPGYDLTAWFAAFLLAKVPQEAVEKLAGIVQAAPRNSQYVEFMRGIGAESQSSTRAQLSQPVITETQAWTKLVEMAGTTPE